MICDVSKHQGKINWDKLAPKLDFCVIKASGLYTNGADPFYAQNVAGAVSHGVPFHAYHFLYCLTLEEAKRDAALFYRTVAAQGHWPLTWVLDCEQEWGIVNSRARPVAEAFEAELRRLARLSGPGEIRVAVYIGHNVYTAYALDYSRYDFVWIPRYGANNGTEEGSTRPAYPCDLWQYTSKGKLPGVDGNVDLNVLIESKSLAYFTTDNSIHGGEKEMATNRAKYITSTGTHYIANSGSDENGAYKGGKAGDQTGKEFCLRAWYNRPWTCVLRFDDIRVGTLLAELGIDAALNDLIGYDQGQRDSFWKQLKAVGYLPSLITVACEEDCTAGVNAIVHAAAYLLGIGTLKSIPETGVRSANMRKYYQAAGFKVLLDSKYLKSGDYLLPGDILLYDNHHAATNVTAGKKVSYTYESVISAFLAGKTPAGGLKKGSSGEVVKTMQLLLLKWKPDCLPKFGADGDFGSETEKALKAFQQAKGLEVTGIYDTATEKALQEKVYGKVEITGGSLNVRTAPGYDTKILGVAHKGDVLIYQGETRQAEGKDWYLIVFNGQNAWVSSKYAKLVE